VGRCDPHGSLSGLRPRLEDGHAQFIAVAFAHSFS
jgi:hypothetical protein